MKDMSNYKFLYYLGELDSDNIALQ